MFRNIGEIQKYWIDYMKKNPIIERVTVKVPRFNCEIYLTVNGQNEIDILTIHE